MGMSEETKEEWYRLENELDNLCKLQEALFRVRIALHEAHSITGDCTTCDIADFGCCLTEIDEFLSRKEAFFLDVNQDLLQEQKELDKDDKEENHEN